MQTLRIKIVFICFLNVLFKTFKYINGKRIQKNIYAFQTNYIYALFNVVKYLFLIVWLKKFCWERT